MPLGDPVAEATFGQGFFMRLFLALCALFAFVAASLAISAGPAPRSPLSGGTRDFSERFDDEVGDGDDEATDAPFARNFSSDPFVDPALLIDGDGLQRVEWADDDPVYLGDASGSLTALYDSSLPAVRIGFDLPRTLSEEDRFTAAAVFVIESDSA